MFWGDCVVLCFERVAYLNSKRQAECFCPSSRRHQHKPYFINTSWTFNQKMWKSPYDFSLHRYFPKTTVVRNQRKTYFRQSQQLSVQILFWPKKGEFEGSAQAASAPRHKPFVLMMSQSTDYLEIYRWGMLKGIWGVVILKAILRLFECITSNTERYFEGSNNWSPGLRRSLWLVGGRHMVKVLIVANQCIAYIEDDCLCQSITIHYSLRNFLYDLVNVIFSVCSVDVGISR